MVLPVGSGGQTSLGLTANCLSAEPSHWPKNRVFLTRQHSSHLSVQTWNILYFQNTLLDCGFTSLIIHLPSNIGTVFISTPSKTHIHRIPQHTHTYKWCWVNRLVICNEMNINFLTLNKTRFKVGCKTKHRCKQSMLMNGRK